MHYVIIFLRFCRSSRCSRHLHSRNTPTAQKYSRSFEELRTNSRFGPVGQACPCVFRPCSCASRSIAFAPGVYDRSHGPKSIDFISTHLLVPKQKRPCICKMVWRALVFGGRELVLQASACPHVQLKSEHK